MSDEIVRRLRDKNKRTVSIIKESFDKDRLYEAGEDEEDEDEETLATEDDVNTTDAEGEIPEEGDLDDYAVSDEDIASARGPIPTEGEDAEEDDYVNPEGDTEEESEASPEEVSDEYVNPLDNHFAVKHTIGEEVLLAYSNGTKSKLKGEIDGYDTEGFYRIRWSNGLTTNGITDLALADLVSATHESTECVCGNTKFVNESNQVVCDKCGRVIKESKSFNIISLSDKSRSKGKKLIRSEAHPISTAMNEESYRPGPSPAPKFSDSGYAVSYIYDGDKLSDYQSTIIVVASSEEEAISRARNEVPGRHFSIDTTVGNKGFINSVKQWKLAHPRSNYEVYESTDCGKSSPMNTSTRPNIREAIKKALRGNKSIKEDIEEDIFSRLKSLENEFWTRIPEIKADIEELGYTVDDINDEYVVVSATDDEDNDYGLLIPIGGTSRTMTLDFRRARSV